MKSALENLETSYSDEERRERRRRERLRLLAVCPKLLPDKRLRYYLAALARRSRQDNIIYSPDPLHQRAIYELPVGKQHWFKDFYNSQIFGEQEHTNGTITAAPHRWSEFLALLK